MRQTALGVVLAAGTAVAASAQVPAGPEIFVNSENSAYQYAPAVAATPGGDFVVVWLTFSGYYNAYHQVLGRRFDAAGAPRGADFLVSAYTTDGAERPDVALDPRGGFVVAWQARGPADSPRILARRFASTGTPLGAEFPVNTTTDPHRNPAVAVQPGKGFVVVWDSGAASPYGYAASVT